MTLNYLVTGKKLLLGGDLIKWRWKIQDDLMSSFPRERELADISWNSAGSICIWNFIWHQWGWMVYLCLVDSVGIPMWHLMWSETRCAVVCCDETDSKAWSHKNVWDETIGIIFDVIIVIIVIITIIIVIKVSMKTESIILLKSHLVSHHTVCLSADFAASSSIQELLHPYIYPVWFFEAEAILPSQCVWPYLAGQK